MKKEMFEISKLKVNPKNPRIIKDEKFKRLCKSIQDFPEMMPLRPIIYDENKIILGGNMRFKALQHLGMKEVPADWVKSANELNEEQKKEFVIKDNNSFGEYDYDLLANEWDDLPLEEWGVDISISDSRSEIKEEKLTAVRQGHILISTPIENFAEVKNLVESVLINTTVEIVVSAN